MLIQVLSPVDYRWLIYSQIPFGTKRAEIIAFLGRNSRILNDNQEPVHIIMERVSSKTQDCYVEFVTLQDAVKAAERHKENVQRGRPTRLGDRPVEIQVSSQAALMQDLFPLASGVFWDGAKPMIQAPIPGQPWKTFKGFVTEEEMTMLVKHVEMPQRVSLICRVSFVCEEVQAANCTCDYSLRTPRSAPSAPTSA